MSKLFVIYDGRAIDGNTEDASVYCCADSLKEAKRDVREMFPDGVIFSYDTAPDGKTLINERQETWGSEVTPRTRR